MIPSAPLVRGAIRAMKVIPMPVARALGRLAGTAAWAAFPGRRRTIMENLSHTAPGASPGERRRLCRRTFANMAEAAVHLFRLPSMTREELFALFTVEGREHLDAARAMSRGVIIVSSHLGPYELGAAWVAAAGYPVHAMVEGLPPDVLDALSAYREATGLQLFDMRNGVRTVYRLLEERQIVLLAADRAIGQAKTAIALPFAGGTRRLPSGPSLFSVGTGAPVVVGRVVRNPRRTPHYLMRFEPALLPNGDGEEAQLDLARRIADRLSAAVQEHPDQWYVFQPKWIENDGV